MRVSPAASTSSSSLPISGERHTSALTSATRSVPISSTAKRPRLGLDDGSHLSQSASATLNHNSNHIGGSGSPTFPFRLDVDLPSSYSTVIPSLPHLHSPHPSLNALYPGGSMPGMISAPPSFLSNSPFDLSRPSQQQQQPLRSVTYAQSTPSHYSPTGHQHPPSIFSRAAGGQGGGGAGGAGGIFAELLGSAGEHGNGGGGHGGQFPSFDWPVHGAGTSQQGSQGPHENGAYSLPLRPLRTCSRSRSRS